MLFPDRRLLEIHGGALRKGRFGELPSRQLASINLIAPVLAWLRGNGGRIPASKYLQGQVGRAGAHQFVRIRIAADDTPAEIIIGRSIDRSARGSRESAQQLGRHK